MERIERLEEQKGGIGQDIKDLYNEADGRGFDKKVLRRLIKERKEDRDQLIHEARLLEVFREALEMPGFGDACREAEASKPQHETKEKVISLAGKTIECLAKIRKNGGAFKPIQKSDQKLAERLTEMGMLEEVEKNTIWRLTQLGESQVPVVLM